MFQVNKIMQKPYGTSKILDQKSVSVQCTMWFLKGKGLILLIVLSLYLPLALSLSLSLPRSILFDFILPLTHIDIWL